MSSFDVTPSAVRAAAGRMDGQGAGVAQSGASGAAAVRASAAGAGEGPLVAALEQLAGELGVRAGRMADAAASSADAMAAAAATYVSDDLAAAANLGRSVPP